MILSLGVQIFLRRDIGWEECHWEVLVDCLILLPAGGVAGCGK